MNDSELRQLTLLQSQTRRTGYWISDFAG